jgi:putative transposase
MAKIKECFNVSSRRYGLRRIDSALKIGRNTVRKVLKNEGLKAISPKSFKPKITNSKHGFGYNEKFVE